MSPSPYLLFNFWFDKYNQKQEQKNSGLSMLEMLAQSTSKNLLFIYSVICDQTVKSDLLGVFLANSSMFPNPFLLAVLLSHSCRRSPPGHSALALSQYKVICLRTFTLCSVQCCKTRNSLYFPWYRVSNTEAWGQQYLKKRCLPQVYTNKSDLTF